MGFGLRSITAQGTDSSTPDSWTPYQSIDAARSAARGLDRADPALRVVLVVGSAGSFVEWIER